MSNRNELYNDKEVKKYFDSIKDKFYKIIKYENRINILTQLMGYTGFGGVPAFLVALLIVYLTSGSGQLSVIIILLFWVITALILILPLKFYQKKLKRMPYKDFEKLFFFSYSAYQNVISHKNAEDFELLKIAGKYLSKNEFSDLKEKIFSAFKIPGLKTIYLSNIYNMLEVNKKDVVPRLEEGIEIDETIPFIRNFVHYFYYEKDKDIEKQEKLADNSHNLFGELKPYKRLKRIDLNNLNSKTFSSSNVAIRTFSFSFCILLIFIIVGCIIHFYDVIIFSSENYVILIVGALSTSVLGGIGMAGMYKNK